MKCPGSISIRQTHGRLRPDRYPRAFDAVFCSKAIKHIRDYRDILAEICRVRRLDGRQFLTVPSFSNASRFDSCWCGISGGPIDALIRLGVLSRLSVSIAIVAARSSS